MKTKTAAESEVSAPAATPAVQPKAASREDAREARVIAEALARRFAG